jgi:hypothetical protein
MPTYRVHCNGINSLIEAESRDNALMLALAQVVAARLFALMPADLTVEEWEELAGVNADGPIARA